jgi:hypothetical protein
MMKQSSKEKSTLGTTLPRSGSKENATPKSKPGTRNGRPAPLVNKSINNAVLTEKINELINTGEVKRHRNNFINETFNSPANEFRARRDLSLNNDILNDSMRSESRPKDNNTSLNPYGDNNSVTNKRNSLSIQSTPKNEIGIE